MKPNEKGVINWVSTQNLYRDDLWYKLKACLKAWGVTALVMFFFLFILFLIAEKFRFSLKLFTLPSIVGGGAFVFLTAFTLPSLFLFAWANGGVDEWECELDRHGINGRKISHNQGRLKFLRSIAWIMMLFPMKPGQRIALHNFLYDKGQKEKYFDLSMLRGATCDEKRGKIAIDTLNGIESIYMPREVYAEVAEFIEVLRQKKRAKRKPAGAGKRKPETVSETAERTTAPSTRRSTRSEGARGTPRSGTTPSTPWPADRASGR